jgi:DNA helicase-2/ATP-dependent DNA helicase PcrA
VNLCVIGDPDQAIYGFRGADRRYFLHFERDYPGAVKLNLSRNYRSSQRILDAAMQVIARNPDRQALHIFSNFVDEIKLDVYRAPTDKAEAEYVVHQSEQMVGGTSYFSLDSGRATGDTPAAARSFADFVVLYRLSAQSRLLVEAFDRSGIPYQTIGQTPLYRQKVVREALAYLWLLQNPRSQVHLEAVLAAGKPTVRQSARLPGLAAFLGELEGARGAAPVARWIEQVSQFMAQQRSAPLSDADAGRLHQLALRAVPFGARLTDFLEATALQSETDAYDSRADRVSLMTLHAAKGLEFPVVFIVGCEEGLLPYERPMASSEIGQSTDEGMDVEEERRLFYVGLTRARNKLVLTHARTRFLFGQRMQNPVSPFVNDIEAAFKEVREMQRRPREEGPEEVQLSLF